MLLTNVGRHQKINKMVKLLKNQKKLKNEFWIAVCYKNS